MTTKSNTTDHRSTARGTPCARSWDDGWIAAVDEKESVLRRRICGARTAAGTPCCLLPNHDNGRCAHHGGFDLTGAPEGNRNAQLHGLYSRRLMICGRHCPAWESCPLGGGAADNGKSVLDLPRPERPVCPFEQAEYDASVIDATHHAGCGNYNYRPHAVQKSHALALLRVMVSRAAIALREQPMLEIVPSKTSYGERAATRPSALFTAFHRLSMELRRTEAEFSRAFPHPAPDALDDKRHERLAEQTPDTGPDRLLNIAQADQPHRRPRPKRKPPSPGAAHKRPPVQDSSAPDHQPPVSDADDAGGSAVCVPLKKQGAEHKRTLEKTPATPVAQHSTGNPNPAQNRSLCVPSPSAGRPPP